MKKSILPKEVLIENTSLDKKIIEEFENIEAQLQIAGIVLKPKYTLSPPLGENVLSINMQITTRSGAS
ncbi:MAG: hypothetical protein NT106_07505 [Candidatus Sumerlaeota bacterium]|nr:hypothetical protein [Candidatus Sumerlaeota bacterium]